MARRNSRFVNQKIIIGNKSIQAGDLTDSAKDELGADSAFVKTVDGLDGSKISANTINPTAIANQDQLIASTGALTTGGILTISRDGGNSFINFDSSNQFAGQDSSLLITETPTGFDFIGKYVTGSLPFITSSRITINLQTPIQNQQDLLNFFNVNAGAETDEIHSVQIFDSATENNYEYALEDENGVLHYLNLLDSIPYGDTRLTVADSNNEVFINNGQRLWQGIKGAKLADSALEFGDSDAVGLQIRNIGSRLRFRTRKSVPSSETGGAPASYKLDAPEGPIGVGVSNPVYSKVSPRFVYKVIKGTQAQGFVSGYTSGGTPPNTPASNTIQKFPFATDANSTDVGDLTVSRKYAAGQSSTVSGYTSGGTPTTNVIDKFPFATDANATDVGDLTVARNGLAGQSSGASGYTSGGSPNNTEHIIDKFPFASDANATDVGDLTVGRRYAAGQSSTVSGYTSGGNAPTGIANVIDKFPFATDANATDVGDLVIARTMAAGQSSTVSGYTSGGEPSPAVSNTIEKFPFASDTNATDVGDMTIPRYQVAGQSSTVSGYTSGGDRPSGIQNVIDKFPFASDANATDVGDLIAARQEAAGQQV